MRRMLRIELLVLAIAAASVALGCANGSERDVCAEAVSKVQADCAFQVETGGGSFNCSGAAECASECLLSAECEEIKANDPDSTYGKCVASCQNR